MHPTAGGTGSLQRREVTVWERVRRPRRRDASQDKGIADAGEPLANDEHWRTTFADHLANVCPSEILDAPIEGGPARFWMLVRSRAALAQSPPPEPSAGRRGAAA